MGIHSTSNEFHSQSAQPDSRRSLLPHFSACGNHSRSMRSVQETQPRECHISSEHSFLRCLLLTEAAYHVQPKPLRFVFTNLRSTTDRASRLLCLRSTTKQSQSPAVPEVNYQAEPVACCARGQLPNRASRLLCLWLLEQPAALCCLTGRGASKTCGVFTGPRALTG